MPKLEEIHKERMTFFGQFLKVFETLHKKSEDVCSVMYLLTALSIHGEG